MMATDNSNTSKKSRVIKKYPNRRLYDTTVSRYITLQDIKALVLQCEDFHVIDAKSGNDLTNTTLLQIIVEQEDHQSPILTREILQNLIRFYGNSMQSMMSNYLEQSMNFFIEQSANMKQGMNVWFENNPLQWMTDIADRNMQLWQSLQDSFVQDQGQRNENAADPSEEQSNDGKNDS